MSFYMAKINENTEIGDNGIKLKDLSYNLITEGSVVKCGYSVDDKEVYVKRINLGSCPNSTYKLVDTGLIINNINVLNLKGIAIWNKYILTLPYIQINSDGLTTSSISIYLEGNSITINSSGDMSSGTAIVDIYFTYK
jgi:hypothetical protein